MSRMGAEGYSSKGQTQISARVAETLKQDFRGACESQDEAMTDVIKRSMREYVDEYGTVAVDEGTDAYYPDDDNLRELYTACLDVADEGDCGYKVYQRRHASTIAQETRITTKQELPDAMNQLRRAGYASMGPLPVDLRGESAKRWRNWIIKPPAADPEQWKFREGQR